MRVYLMTDLEGVVGVWGWDKRDDDTQDNFSYRMRVRALLAEEVNAAVRGFFDGGATQVVVNDGHGAGTNLDPEALDPRITLIQGRERPFWLPLLDDSFDATALVGAHAMAGTPFANLSHSMSGAIRRYTFNGTPHGEIGMQAMIAGHWGVPMIFLAGDWYACREVEGFISGIETVATKQGLSSLSHVALTPQAAREAIAKKACKAIGKVGQIQPYGVGEPLTFREERYKAAFDAENPPEAGSVIDSHTRQIEADDIIDLFHQYYGYAAEQPQAQELG